jgi:hypothetical protein
VGEQRAGVTLLNRTSQSVRLRLADAAFRRRDALTSPRRLTGYVGNTDFRATGEEFRGLSVDRVAHTTRRLRPRR